MNGAEINDIRSVHFGRLRYRVMVIGGLIIFAFAGSSAYDAWRSYGHALIVIGRESGNVAGGFAGETAWSVQAVDLVLREAARWYQNGGHASEPQQINDVLASRAAGVPQVRLMMIVDAQGMQKYRSHATAAPYTNVADRSYFIAQRDGTAKGYFISEPVVTRSENRGAIILSRRLEGAHGEFAGVVTAVVDLDDLEQLYGAVDLGNGSAIQLLREDGTLLVRNPPAPSYVGRHFVDFVAASNAPGTRVVSPIDGRREFISSARVRDTQLLVAVTRDEAAALRSWRDEVIALAVRTLAVALLGVIAVAVLVRQLRSVEASQRALRVSEERYQQVMEGANEGHWDWDLTTDRIFLSSRMRLMHGQDADGPVTTHAAWRSAITVHPEDSPGIAAAIGEHLEGRTPQFSREYRVKQTTGEWRWVLTRGRCLRDALGTPRRFVGSAIDLTVQKQAQQDKERLEGQLRQSQKMDALGTLAGGIAHDFNNILGAIIGYGELAEQHSAASGDLQRYLANILHAASRAQKLVDRILGFSRSGMAERVPVHIQSVIEDALELLAGSMPAGIRINSDLKAGGAAVIGDATHLQQVAMNLCTNALHAMQEGGVLSVVLERIESRQQRELLRGTLEPGRYVRLIVADTGTGLPAAIMERMFDPFFTTKKVGEGTGLGLSLVQGIVSDLGGAIDVTTQEGVGTSFEIWLPTEGEAERMTSAVHRALPRGSGQTVMIVDDEHALVALAEEMLAELGYEPVGFRSSIAALETFRQEPERFDAVITDEAMPDLGGTDLAREIRRLRPDIPIIVTTGHGGAKLADRAAATGVREVLRKPLKGLDLAEALARALRVSA